MVPYFSPASRAASWLSVSASILDPPLDLLALRVAAAKAQADLWYSTRTCEGRVLQPCHLGLNSTLVEGDRRDKRKARAFARALVQCWVGWGLVGAEHGECAGHNPKIGIKVLIEKRRVIMFKPSNSL